MENIKKMLVFLSILLIMLIGVLIFLLLRQNLTAQAIAEPNTYSFTKAICENNICQDYEITCQGNKTLGITPVSNPVELPENWKDPRSKEEIEKTCE